MSTATIPAIDLGKFKSVASTHDAMLGLLQGIGPPPLAVIKCPHRRDRKSVV